jgi:hypothetical protein
MKTHLYIILTLLVIFFVAMATPKPIYGDIITPIISIEETEVESINPLEILDPRLLPVCGCESMGSPHATPRQFNSDGSVLRGYVNPQDIGMCQINEHYWLDKSIELGLDIYTEEGNVRMANYILSTQGIGAWIWSKPCWGHVDN